MNKILGVLAFTFSLVSVQKTHAQVYAEQKTQHRFAQSYIGLNTQVIPSSGRLIFENQEYQFPTTAIPRLTMGGLHFWGKLDFNMNLPLTRFGEKRITEDTEATFTTGADLSARFYPWRLLDGKLRPYAGLSFNTMSLSVDNKNSGQRFEGFITYSLLGGVSITYKGWQVNSEMMFLPHNGRDFYSNRQDKHKFKLPSSYFSLGIVRFFDFTLGEEKPKLSGKTKALEEKVLSKGKSKLNSISLGIAPNGSYFLKSPSFSDELKSLPKHKGSFNFEYNLGYLLHKQKLHFGLTYRNYSANAVSYELEHVVRREALSFEAIKFVANYHGFVPFVGATLSAERWATGLFINDIQQGETSRSQIFSPGIIFGWDIRPSPTDVWVLRTNLRYYPYQAINDGATGRARVDQFEFNFIQFVFYPNRWANVRKASKELDFYSGKDS